MTTINFLLLAIAVLIPQQYAPYLLGVLGLLIAGDVCKTNIRKWDKPDMTKLAIILSLWVLSAFVFTFFATRITMLGNHIFINILPAFCLFLANNSSPANLIKLIILAAMLFGGAIGFLISLVYKNDKKSFRILQYANYPISFFSLFCIFQLISSYTDGDLSMIILQCLFFILGISLQLYNSAKVKNTGVHSKTQHLLLGLEFILFFEIVFCTFMLNPTMNN